MTYEGGYYGTEGIVHTGIGPFRLESGSYMAYGRVAYNKGALRVSAFGNFLDATAPEPAGDRPRHAGPDACWTSRPRPTTSRSATRTCWAGKHILTYGGNVRQNNFDISLAQGDDRTELGAYVQWEYFVDKFRFALGGRVDKFGNIDDPVFSPRVSVMFKPTPDALDPRLLQPGVRVAVLHQQLPEPEHLQFPTPHRPHAAQAAARAGGGARPAALPA